jgi:3-phosphoshikimate 1-carboxyvinyltransferase
MSLIGVDLHGVVLNGTVNLPVSKSLCNRALILQALFPELKLSSVSEAEDTVVLSRALKSSSDCIDLGAAGTAMRFATAFFAARPGAHVVLTGSNRMKNRPVGELVNALQQLGAQITYLEKEGFPPLQVQGKNLSGGCIAVKGTTSSQFISALMLIAPTFVEGLTIEIEGEPVSKPYISMTAQLMNELGLPVVFEENTIQVGCASKLSVSMYAPEADWSAAAYWFALVALMPGSELFLPHLKPNSLQGDSRLRSIFEELGVRSSFSEQGLHLRHRRALLPHKLVMNLIDNPDLAQPLAVFCAVAGMGADFRGLSTLRIKETDRLAALATELLKVGCQVDTGDDFLRFDPVQIHPPKEAFETYEDHRMAMSLALIATRFPIEIKNPEVVAKSYPGFWEELKKLRARNNQ